MFELDKINKKDFLFKVMFALEVALLPLILAAKLSFPDWLMYGSITALLIVKLVMTMIKNPSENMHIYLDSIGNVVVLCFCLITFCCFGYVNIALTAMVCSLFALQEVAKVYFFFKPNNQMVEGLNFANELFLFVTIASLLMIEINTLILTVSVIALIIASALLVCIQGYKFIYYYVINNQNKKRY